MNCNFSEKVSLLIDGELSSNEARTLERHLLECVDCRQLHKDFLGLRSQFDAYIPARVPVATRPELAHLLSPRPAASARRKPWWEMFGGRLSPATVALVAVFVIAGVVAVVLQFRSQRRVPSSDSPPQSTIVRQQPGIAPRPLPSPTVVSPKQSDEGIVRNPKSGQPGADRRKTVTPENSNSAGVRWPRSRPRLRTPSPTENPDGPEYVALDSNNAVTAGIGRLLSAESPTAQHLEQSELLLRTFRNLRLSPQSGRDDLGYERRRAQQLFYQNVLLRREADAAGDVQVATLLESLEPILLDIANLPERAGREDVRAIKERVERQNLVALLQINATSPVRAYD